MKPLLHVIAQHVSEAGFLWQLRDAASVAPHYGLSGLLDLDERVEAHLDGLRVAGEAAWELALEALGEEGGPTAGQVFATTVLAAELGAGERLEVVLDAVLHQAVPDSRAHRGLVSALGWLDKEIAVSIAAELASSKRSPLERRIGLAGFAARRMDPGHLLEDALVDADEGLRARALRVVGTLGRADLLDEVRPHLGSVDMSTRFGAAWSLALVEDADAIDRMATIATEGGPFAIEAARIGLRRFPLSKVRSWASKTTRAEGGARTAILGLGASGSAEAVDLALEHLDDPATARIAAEAAFTVTGVRLGAEGLTQDAPEGFDAGPNDDPEDENVTPDPDEQLPWPQPERLRRWWKAHRSRFVDGQRYFLGQPINQEWLKQAMRHASQRQRRAASIELAMLTRTAPIEVRARAPRQLGVGP